MDDVDKWRVPHVGVVAAAACEHADVFTGTGSISCAMSSVSIFLVSSSSLVVVPFVVIVLVMVVGVDELVGCVPLKDVELDVTGSNELEEL